MIDDPGRSTNLANDDALARKRFMAIQTMRFMGAALVILGMLIVNGNIDLPRVAGYVLVLVGIVDALFMPTILTRRWKSPLE
jgi:hypothetical protein